MKNIVHGNFFGSAMQGTVSSGIDSIYLWKVYTIYGSGYFSLTVFVGYFVCMPTVCCTNILPTPVVQGNLFAKGKYLYFYLQAL